MTQELTVQHATKIRRDYANWITTVVAVVALFSAGMIAWGKASQKLDDHDQRIINLERDRETLMAVKSWMDKHP